MVNIKNSDIWGGVWSRKKLDCVEDYLEAFLNVMQNQTQWKLVYFDAFSGSGKQHIKNRASDSQQMSFGDQSINEFLEGSALRALKLTSNRESENRRGFAKFEFIDIDNEAIQSLNEKVAEEYPQLSSRCEYHCGDSNLILPKTLEQYDWSKTRGVIFIDPFKPNMTVDMLKCVAKTQALDVWFLFPLSGIGRMMARDEKAINDSWNNKLDMFYGSHDWHETLYTANDQLTLIENEESLQTLTRKQGYEDLLRYTEEWLKTIFGASNVLPPRVLHAGTSPHFALFAAISSTREPAIKLWKKISKHILDHL